MFITTRDWHKAVLGERALILRHTSALVHLQLFSGYAQAQPVEVYATEHGELDNMVWDAQAQAWVTEQPT